MPDIVGMLDRDGARHQAEDAQEYGISHLAVGGMCSDVAEHRQEVVQYGIVRVRAGTAGQGERS